MIKMHSNKKKKKEPSQGGNITLPPPSSSLHHSQALGQQFSTLTDLRHPSEKATSSFSLSFF